jgi:hydrogenase expression/formation protein HypC
MCLAVRGSILTISDQPPVGASSEAATDEPLWRMAEVDFGGVRHWVSLACLPDARVGDRVLVHVGLAIALVDDDEDGPHSLDARRSSATGQAGPGPNRAPGG